MQPANGPRIWVDADSCPKDIKPLLFRCAQRRKLHCYFVSNQNHGLPKSPYIHLCLQEPGPDCSDAYIRIEAKPGDLVITRDIPLAAQLLKTGLCVINDRGDEFLAETISARLQERDLKQELRELQLLPTSNKRSYGPKEVQAFAACFDRCLQRLLRALNEL